MTNVSLPVDTIKDGVESGRTFRIIDLIDGIQPDGFWVWINTLLQDARMVSFGITDAKVGAYRAIVSRQYSRVNHL